MTSSPDTGVWFSCPLPGSKSKGSVPVLRVPLPLGVEDGDEEFLLGALARRFGLGDQTDIVGFRHQQIVYPASYVAKVVCGNVNLADSSETSPLEVLVKLRATDPSGTKEVERKEEGKQEVYHNTEDDISDEDLEPEVRLRLTDNIAIRVKRSDLQTLNFLRLRTRLSDATPAEIFEVFSDVCSGSDEANLVTKATYDDIVSAYFITNPERREETKFLMFLFSKIFYAFDRDGDDMANLKELVAGLGFLSRSAGSREKMMTAFRAFDADEDGYLSPSEVLCMLRSALTVVLGLNEHMGTLDASDVDSAINRITSELVIAVYTAVRGCESINDLDTVDCLISFEELEAWHLRLGGVEAMPWLTILFDDTLFGELTESGADDVGEEPNSAEDGIVFEFELGSGCGTIPFFVDDVEVFAYAVAVSGISSVDIADAYDVFSALSSPGDDEEDDLVLTKPGFQEAVRLLILKDSTPPESTALLSAFFGRIFDVHDRSESGSVDLAQFFGSFSILLAGTKSEKLAGVFTIFSDGADDDADGTMSPEFLAKYIRSFLTGLVALNQTTRKVIPVRIYRIIDKTCTEIVHTILECVGESDSDENAFVTFEEFGSWYNSGGHELIPWLELLDARKWLVGGVASTSDDEGGAEEEEDGEVDGAAGEDDDDSIFAFCLTAEGDTLAIRQEDCDVVCAIRALTEPCDVSPVDVHAKFGAKAVEGAICKADFDEGVRDLISGEKLGNDQKLFLSQVLSNLFYAYDREGTGEVRLKELVCGFSTLSKGSKSDKLALAFRVFDADEDSALSHQEFARFLRSFLTALFALNRHASQCPAEDVWGLIDESALQFSSRIFEEADMDENADHIAFEEFADWYTSGGFELVPWLELLDMDKWPGEYKGVDALGAEFQARDQGLGDSPVDAVGSEVVFKFKLTESGDDDETLVLRKRDVLHLQHVVASSSSFTMEPQAFVDAFMSHSRESETGLRVVTKKDFDAAIRSLIPASSLSTEEKSYLSFALSNVFFAFDREERASVGASELTSGMLLFCSGRKSDKLAIAFNLFDADSDGALSREELWAFIRCFLTILFALNEDSATKDADEMWRKIDQICIEVCARILSEINAQARGKVTFFEFADWYTEGGYNIVPWLELLDLTKWPLLDVAAGNAAELATEASEQEGGSEACFRFELAEGRELELMARDILGLEAILASTRLYTYSPEKVREMLGDAEVDGALTKQAFDSCVRALVPGASLTTTEKEYLSAALSNVFYAYERDGSNEVRIKEFLSGFVLFCSGNKSDKLALTFDLFDADDDGLLSEQELARFLRSFLTVLFALNESAAQSSAEDVWTLVDESALHFASRAMRDIDGSESGISFEQFADW